MLPFDKIAVFLSGAAGIIFVYWFFLAKKDKVVSAVGSIDILVNGGYSPSTISIKKGQPTKINFLRKDPSSCLEEIVLSDFKIKKFLPLNQKVSITLNPDRAGVYDIVCGMNMFHGKLIVEE